MRYLPSPTLILRLLRGLCCCAITIIALGASSTPARAGLTINPTFDKTITSDKNAAAIEATINQAIAFYEKEFTNTTTVNITFREMPGGLGASSTAVVEYTYSQVQSALAADALAHPNDPYKRSAVASLPSGTTIDGSPNMWVTTANARALLGYTTPGSDGTISLNTSATFPPNGQAGNYSLIAVTEHEIDEVLGLGSGLNLSTSFPRLPRLEDLYRYSAQGVLSFSTSDPSAYFSIDGGKTNLDSFNQSGSGDFGDWVIHSPAQVQDWAGTPSTILQLNPNSIEAIALDVIGFDAVPEPVSLTLLGSLTLGLSGYHFWRARRRSPEMKTASASSEEPADAVS